MNIEVLEFATFIDRLNKGEFDIALSGWTTSTGDADYTYFSQFHSSKLGPQGNRVGREIEGMNILLEQARSSSDANKRMMLYKQVEEILTEQSIFRPLLATTITLGISSDVKNFSIIPNGYHKFDKVSIE